MDLILCQGLRRINKPKSLAQAFTQESTPEEPTLHSMSPLRFLKGIFLIYQPPPQSVPPSVFSSQLKPTLSNINCLGQKSWNPPSPHLHLCLFPTTPWPPPGSNSFVAASRFCLDPTSKTRSYNFRVSNPKWYSALRWCSGNWRCNYWTTRWFGSYFGN